MHMHATTGDGMRHKILIRKPSFVVQYRWEASLPEHLARHNGTLIVFLQIRIVSI